MRQKNKKVNFFLSIILAIILISCQSDIELIDSEREPVLPETTPIRPDFNRSEIPSPPPEPEREITPAPPAPNQTSPIVGPRDYRTFQVPINTSLYSIIQTIGLEELPLLRPAAIQTGDNMFRGYRQFIHNPQDSIKPIFLLDDYRRDEYLGDVLFFRYNTPFINYSIIRNNNRPFFDDTLVGSNILLAGRVYRVMEASNHSLVLNGVDVEQQMILTHNRTLQSNQQTIPQSSVFYKGALTQYHVLTPNRDNQGLFLRPGEYLRDRSQEPLAFLGDLDLRYDGLEELVGQTLRFRVFDNRVLLQWEGSEGLVSIPLLGFNENDELIHGDRNKVHFFECNNNNDGCVNTDDILIMHASAPQETLTRLLRVTNINAETKRIHLRDVETREQLFLRYERPNPRANGVAEFSFLNQQYKLFVINETIPNPDNLSENISVASSLAVDLTGNNMVRSEQVPLYVGPVRISLDNPLPQDFNETTYTLNITLSTNSRAVKQGVDNKGFLSHEQLHVQVVYENNEFFVRMPTNPEQQLWNQELFQKRNEHDSYGLSLWGSEITMLDGVQETTRDLIITIPYEQRLAQISIGRLE